MQVKRYTIGEFSKITGVSIKSLRYYDEIGILKPAYVNQSTKYRYYVPEQFISLDIIKLFIAFEYPLKELKYDGIYELDNIIDLIKKGQKIMNDKIENINRVLSLSSDIIRQVKKISNLKKNQLTRYHLPSIKLLSCPWERGKDKQNEYIEKIANLHQKATKEKLVVLAKQGILTDFNKNISYVVLSFSGDYIGNDVITFDEGDYLCTLIDETSILKVDELYKNNNINIHFMFYINTDIYNYVNGENLKTLEAICVEN